MKLKAQLLGILAALGLALSLVGPASAVDSSATAPVTVTLADNGVFAVTLAGTALAPSGPVNALSTGVVAAGTIVIGYVDSKSFRDGFDVTLMAEDFTSSLPIPPFGTSNYGIDASHLVVTSNTNPIQCRWSSGVGFRIGDIGSTTNGADSNHSGSGNHNWVGQPAGTVELDQAQNIAWGFKGPGTASSATCVGTVQPVSLQLNVPNNTPATTYTSTLHVDVTFNAAIP